MERIQLLAAEIFNYSYDNYVDHLGINERFDRLMPRDAEILETALREEWSIDKVAQKLEVSAEEDGLDSPEAIEALVIQISYRTAADGDEENEYWGYRK